MRRNIIYSFAVFVSLLFLFSCSDSNSGYKVLPDVADKGVTARKTLLIYMMAENSLSDYATSDVAEIVKAAGSVPEDCRLFVYVDDKKFPILTQYFCMTDGSIGNTNFHPFSEDVCSSDISVLANLLDYILSDYPTESLDLVLWSHGDGWLRAPMNVAPQRSIGIDNGKNTYSNNVTETIEIEELAALLENLPLKVDRLLFDACFMQCVESSYALRKAVNWVIASPAEIPGDGAPYDKVIPEFFHSSGPEGIVDAYVKGYESEAGGVVLSAVDTEKMQYLADVTYSYIIKYFNTGKKRDYIDVFSYLPGGKYNSAKAYPSYFDMNAVMRKYLTAEEYSNWREAFDNAVAYTSSSNGWYSAICMRMINYDKTVAGGMSLYMPQKYSRNDRFNADFRTTEWYSAAGWDVAGW